VLLPGCGQFQPAASFVLRHPGSDDLVGAVLTSEVAPGVGHTTQLCVQPGFQGHGLGRILMQASAEALRALKYNELTLTVTSENHTAVHLYERLGFSTIKSFTAGVWQRSSLVAVDGFGLHLLLGFLEFVAWEPADGLALRPGCCA
jgi:ribosomal protein S18 acetylase RimI-like enzyme